MNPAWWMWLLFLGLAGSVVIALAPIATWLGILGGVIALILAPVIVYSRASSIVVTEDLLRVGRASIERRFVGEVEAFTDPDDVRRVRGPELDARAYMNFSASASGMCRIEIIDPVDPTPYWLTATRHPHELAQALVG
ncbi:DUF3093 domain-containing protein [Kocuria palustris]|nr:DUF3093 domain-containing protein [Kocuria palustris]MBN6758234.1 DUF3093 domain-containing protein [Kocuria palustris]MBN6763262.1 DUF3093 domain-containing protein [Kocuria palustris]MBN6783340.1 DUF3093 domain-containing protein [Kocuria palustris]MBN6798893.1 DUF3093 domain-containing protein [Kocuria palustris]